MDSETKSRWGVLAYLIGLARAFDKQPRFEATIEADGRTRKLQCLQITVANGIHYGGGMTIAEDAKMDDGRLDALIVPCQNRLRLLGNASRLRWGQTRAADAVMHKRCQDITISTDPVLKVTADGEFLTETPVRCTIQPRALRIFVPDEELT